MDAKSQRLARIGGFFVIFSLCTSFVYGAVRGVVKDSSGAIVPKAKVYLLIAPDRPRIVATND